MRKETDLPKVKMIAHVLLDIAILILSSGNPGTCKRVADDSW